MSDDDRKPRINRTNSSVFPGATYAAGYADSYGNPYLNVGGQSGPTTNDPRSQYNPYLSPYDQNQGTGPADERGRTRTGPAPSTNGTFYDYLLGEVAQRQRISGAGRTVNGAPTDLGEDGVPTQRYQSDAVTAGASSVYDPLGLDIDPDGVFRFDRGAPLNPATGDRTGLANSRGVYGSADSLDRQLTPGQTTPTGTNENYLTISAGVLWLRQLSVRDPAAYNKLVVLLRNAGYGNLPNEDAALPLNGYTQLVGAAFAYAANDLAQANAAGDGRTLLEYLTDRGQGYADYLAQQEADQKAAEAYQPVDRKYQDPSTLRAAAKAAAVDALGRKLTDAEEARFEAAYRAQEENFYNGIDQAGEAKGVFRGYAPDVAGQVNDYIEGDQFATERAANSIGEYAQVFQRLVGLG